MYLLIANQIIFKFFDVTNSIESITAKKLLQKFSKTFQVLKFPYFLTISSFATFDNLLNLLRHAVVTFSRSHKKMKKNSNLRLKTNYFFILPQMSIECNLHLKFFSRKIYFTSTKSPTYRSNIDKFFHCFSMSFFNL